ncbi:heavy-metal-associated domain-containing protein [Gordonia sp. PDNC005]|uniref:heavy-metal-associated domain-containing protein n=1 Tax=unclassified Gordonia (in: high G+C Gram-positive bacteria) TaxID=2657482 RepID=UPI001965E20F|nr:heavy-metal-associated domain-containing protein [Gordonia sp. PDNC005]QRY61061.1 heavy-metal-associated domain-containing protein [Gordonia sp. PDNC005]
MKAGTRLALYGAGLAVAFALAFGISGVVVPDSVVTAWTDRSTSDSHGGEHGGEQVDTHQPAGLSGSAAGLVLSPVEAPSTVGAAGTLRFAILDDHGKPVTMYTRTHDKDLHLIVVRSDGANYAHVHPVLDPSTGTWSVPWTPDAAGSYRVYADFTPAGDTAEGVTLTRTVQVAGDFVPITPDVRTTAQVDGYTVALDGDLAAGSSSDLRLTVSRDGVPVTTLEPYLGAFGHLVALRDGDLAFLHVHPDGPEPAPGSRGGPEIRFGAETPTAGRYLLYLDFQVDGTVRTAEFVLDATG